MKKIVGRSRAGNQSQIIGRRDRMRRHEDGTQSSMRPTVDSGCVADHHIAKATGYTGRAAGLAAKSCSNASVSLQERQGSVIDIPYASGLLGSQVWRPG